MSIAALITWVVTAAAGATLLSIWLTRGGLRRQGRAAAEAATGEASGSLPPEQHFPMALVGLHGLLAVTTLVLVLLATLGVGD